MRQFSIAVFFSLIVLYAKSQDTLTVMYYNILSFAPSNFEKAHYLKDITKYVKPDIILLNEISSDSSCNQILNYVLNTDGDTSYKKAVFIDGPDSDNIMFYKYNKLHLKSQDTIQTDLRNINEYVLALNDSVFTTLHDSVFFNFYVAHLKASTGSTNEQQRLQEVQKLMEHLEEENITGNILFGGDMNFYSSSEPALECLIANGNHQFFDPIDSIGDWHDNANYSHIHTQSTRTTAFGGGATGGMDDRFDFIFISSALVNGSNFSQFIPGSYWAFGNDGHHLNDSLTALPQYNNLPDSITEALYRMSDHLPVVMKILVSEDAKIAEHHINRDNHINIYPNPATHSISFNTTENIYAPMIYFIENISGQVIKTGHISDVSGNVISIMLDDLSNGIYFLRIRTDVKEFYGKFSIEK